MQEEDRKKLDNNASKIKIRGSLRKKESYVIEFLDFFL